MDNAKILAVKERLKIIGELYSSDELVLGHSGGKDSVVIHDLVKQVFPDILVVHNAKCLEGTGKTKKEKETETMFSTLKFLYTEVIKHSNITFMVPSKFKDFVVKHKIKAQIDGSRIHEWNRVGKSSTFIDHGLLKNREDLQFHITSGIFELNVFYLIYDWTDEEVWDYIHSNNLPFSDEYIDNNESETYYAKKQSHLSTTH